ncbi:MAG: EthD domain-containing protein [Deltaproteobacteria bacterium]|nr:EthD domain-containing protein [Deltaproteobacteria bacterium]
MIKAVYIMYRKPGMEVEEFQDYWRSTHGDLVRKIPDLRRYTQCHTLLAGYGRPTPPPADGIEELCFESPEALEVLETSEGGRSALADFDRFTDTSRVCRILTEEIIIKEGTTHENMAKNIEFVTRKPGMPLEEFRKYWKDVHGPIAAKIEVIEHYVQSRALMSEYEKEPPPAYDGVAETWFESTQAMRHSATTPEYAAHHADMLNFLPGELPIIITKEIKMI